MEFRFAPYLITVVVGVILVATILIPIVSDATATEKTFENEGYFAVSKHLSTDEDVSIEWDHASPNIITVNDTDVPLPTSNGSWTIVGTETTALVRYSISGTTITVQIFGTSPQVLCNTTNGYDCIIAITSSGVTLTSTAESGNTATAATTDPIWYAAPNGDYVMKLSDKVAYVNGDSEIYAIGMSQIGGVGGKMITVRGNIDDGFSAEVVYPTSGYTTGDVTATFTESKNYLDLYELDKFQFDATDTGTSTTTAQTYSYFIVPHEVTAEKAKHMSSAEITLAGIIPLLVVVGLILGIVMAIGRRAELF